MRLEHLLPSEANWKGGANHFILTKGKRKQIYRISHGLWCDMIFIQRVVCFLSPSLGEGIENTTSWIKIISHHKTWEILFITYLPPTYLFCIFYSFDLVAGIHNVISKNYHMSDITLISRKICNKNKYM